MSNSNSDESVVYMTSSVEKERPSGPRYLIEYRDGNLLSVGVSDPTWYHSTRASTLWGAKRIADKLARKSYVEQVRVIDRRKS